MRLHELIWLNKYIFVAYGLWPMRPDAGSARRRFANKSAVICLLVPEVMTVAAHWGDIDILGDFGSLIAIHTQLTLKNLYCFLRRRNFRSVYQHLKDFWDISDDPAERQNYEQLAKVAKLATIAFTVICFSNLLSFEATPLVSWLKNRREIKEGLRNRPLLLDFYYSFDIQRTSPNYELLSILQSLDTVKIVKFFISFVTRLMKLIFLYTPAEFLMQNNTAIAKTIYYDVPWVSLSAMRTQKACHVYALYQVMAICRIAGVVNAAFSYMALLRSMKKRRRTNFVLWKE